MRTLRGLQQPAPGSTPLTALAAQVAHSTLHGTKLQREAWSLEDVTRLADAARAGSLAELMAGTATCWRSRPRCGRASACTY
jgi:hypothetical protein